MLPLDTTLGTLRGGGARSSLSDSEFEAVFTQLHSASDREGSENLKILKYVKVAYWLMRHEVAHTNYESLIDLCTDVDGSDFLATWQNQRGENATYKSAATSTEMVKAIGQFLDEKTVHFA